MTKRTAEASPLVYARVAGVACLVIAIVALLYETLVQSKLIVLGNDAATVNNIMANESLFRIGVVLVLIIYVSVGRRCACSKVLTSSNGRSTHEHERREAHRGLVSPRAP